MISQIKKWDELWFYFDSPIGGKGLMPKNREMIWATDLDRNSALKKFSREALQIIVTPVPPKAIFSLKQPP